MTLLARNETILRRIDDLSPVAAAVKAVVLEDNRAMMLHGLETTGGAVRALSPRTLRRRQGAGPRGVPHGDRSRAVTACAVSVTLRPGRVEIVKRWPNFPQVVYLGRTLGITGRGVTDVARLVRRHILATGGGL